MNRDGNRIFILSDGGTRDGIPTKPSVLNMLLNDYLSFNYLLCIIEVLSLVSAISQFLSRFDSLSSHTHFSLSDVLIRRLFNGNLPNNVELWAKRLDSVQ